MLMLLSFLRQDSVLMTMTTCMLLMALSYLEMTLLIVILALDLMVAWLSMLRYLFPKITFIVKTVMVLKSLSLG